MTLQQLNTPCVQYYNKPAKTVISNYAVSVADLFRYITSDRYKMATETLRSLTDPKEYRNYKASNFDFVCFSGIFGYRNDKGLIKHSNLICIDFDHLGELLPETRNVLLADPYFETELLFVSPGGDGLKWIVEIDIARYDHRTWFNGIRNYLQQNYRLLADEKCVNVSRACFLPYDANCYVNPNFYPSINNKYE